MIVFIHGGALMMGGYLYCRQQGLWPKVLTGRDPDEEPRAFDAFCPVRNVTPECPPTLLIHGTKDTDVPYELSVQMAKELAAKHAAMAQISKLGVMLAQKATWVELERLGLVVAVAAVQDGEVLPECLGALEFFQCFDGILHYGIV